MNLMIYGILFLASDASLLEGSDPLRKGKKGFNYFHHLLEENHLGFIGCIYVKDERSQKWTYIFSTACIGNILSPTMVLTVASCVSESSPKKSVKVYAGKGIREIVNEKTDKINIRKTKTFHKDSYEILCLLELETQFEFNHFDGIYEVSILEEDATKLENLKIFGYGKIKKPNSAPTMSVLERYNGFGTICNKSTFICSRFATKEKCSCTYVGMPLMAIKDEYMALIGISSYVDPLVKLKDECRAGMVVKYYTLFPYLEWIKQVVNGENLWLVKLEAEDTFHHQCGQADSNDRLETIGYILFGIFSVCIIVVIFFRYKAL